MKGGRAAMAMAMIAVARAGEMLKGDLVLAFSAAENSSCLGAKKLVEDGHLEGIGALLVSEPSGSRSLVTEKGALWLRAVATGDYVHNAFSGHRTGDRGNAIVRLARYLDKAQDLKLHHATHSHVGPPDISVGLIRGGLDTAFVPPEASADIDVRLVPGQTAEGVLAESRAIRRRARHRRDPRQQAGGRHPGRRPLRPALPRRLPRRDRPADGVWPAKLFRPAIDPQALGPDPDEWAS